jgi:uncharacterized OB-fold protein
VPVGAFARSEETAEFLDAAARGEFLLRRCELGHFSEPAAAACTTCGSAALTWVAASGRARLVSWAVTHGSGPDGQPIRNVLAIGELDEGPWWWSCITDADPQQLAPGTALLVDFERPEGAEEALPVFRLAR